MMPSLPPGPWRWVVINSSGGKDSQTALKVAVEACDAAGLSRDQIVVSHQSLGRMEWEHTLELVHQQASHYGLRVEVSAYRDKTGQEKSLLDYVRKRGMWPSSTSRFCTSEFKRGPGGRVIVKLYRESPGRILNVYGFRAQESPARAKKISLVRNLRFSSSNRDVWDWLPIHDWTLEEVWTSIKSSGVPWHHAYDLGMPRLSCRFCIFAPRGALILSGRHNREVLDEYIAVEVETGHTFRHGQSLSEIRKAIDAGEQPGLLHGTWNM
jgi:3'-phosphoadenosine 5'-phosphosulfate sulfotransferase (PAPS reductase)/FAD synthetase